MSEELERNVGEPEETERAIPRTADEAEADEDFEAHRHTPQDAERHGRHADRHVE